MKILWILFWGNHKNWTISGGNFYAFLGLFLSQWAYFFGLLKFQIFLGVFEIPDIFGG